MRDYEAAPIAQAFWKFQSHPEVPVRIFRIIGDEKERVATWEVPQECEITPSARELGVGLYLVEYAFVDANSKVSSLKRHYLVTGPYAIFHLTDGLADAIRTLLAHQKHNASA